MTTITLPQAKNPQGLIRTDIEWADYAFNPLRAIHRQTGKVGWACQKVSAGCRECYAEVINKRFGTGEPFSAAGMKNVEVVLDHQRVAAALRFRIPRGFTGKAGDGRPKVFVCDMTDLFGEWVPFETMDRLFALFALRPDIDWMLLTKRPERMAEYFDGLDRKYAVHAAMERMCSTLDDGTVPAKLDPLNGRKFIVPAARWAAAPAFPTGLSWPLPNCWLGASFENQQAADLRIHHLLRCPAAVRFVSCEPLLGLVDLIRSIDVVIDVNGDREVPAVDGLAAWIHWVIAGGESGPGARPMHPDWPQSLRDQCVAAGVPFFFKQWGAWEPCRFARLPTSRSYFEFDALDQPQAMHRVGKKAAGRLLDGREWNEFPKEPPHAH